MNSYIIILFYNIIGFCQVKNVLSKNADEDNNPWEIPARIGESVVLGCQIKFPYDIIITHVLEWRKAGELIFSWSDGATVYSDSYANRISMLDEKGALEYGRGSINITSIRETDEGWYECKVLFPNRTPSSKLNGTWYHVKVEGGNLLAVPPMNKTVTNGEEVKLRCVSKYIGAEVNWFKDNVAISEIKDLRERTSVEAEGSLTIAPTLIEDTGFYYCEIKNDEGEGQGAGAFLDVQYKAIVTYSPKQVYLPFGRPGTLHCHFRSNPEITKVRWEKDGFLFDPYNVPGVYSRRNGTLYFTKVDETHAGEYTCTPYNDLGTAGPSPRMNVVVQRPPIFTITPSVYNSRKIGESIMMPCDAVDLETSLKPTIHWFKRDGSQMPLDRTIVTGGNLTIINIQESDSGLYQCIASNDAATISSEAELLIEDMAPNAPYNLTTNATDTTITVKWMQAFIKPKLEYSIWYRATDVQEWRTMKANDRESTEAVIENLSPGKEYEIMILSQDRQGDGMFSKAVKISTMKDGANEEKEVDEEFRSPVGIYQQIGPPHDLYVEITSGGYKVHWKAPAHGTEMLRYYTVKWYEEPETVEKGSVVTTEESYVIKNLEEGKSYKIQILALSTNDYESSSGRYLYHVPEMHRAGALFVGAATGVLVVSIIIAIVWYVRKSEEKEKRSNKA